MTADSDTCGCPFSPKEGIQKVKDSTKGRCSGFLGMTCECLKGHHWISIGL